MPNYSGVWTSRQQLQEIAANLWPSPPQIVWGTPVVYNSGSVSVVVATMAGSKVVVAYNDGSNSDYSTAIVGTVSGNSISFGSKTQINAYYNYNQGTSITYDSGNQKVVFCYRDMSGGATDGYGQAKVGTVSGTSISFGSQYTFSSGNTRWISVSYNSSVGKCGIFFQYNPATYDGQGLVATVSGSTLSFGSKTTFSSGSICNISAAYDITNNAFGVIYNDVNIGNGYVVKATISGSTLSYSSEVLYRTGFSSQNWNGCLAVYNSTQSVVIGSTILFSTTNSGAAGAVSLASTPSVGSQVVFVNNSQYYSPIITNIDGTSKFFVAYTDDSLSYATYFKIGTASGTSISFGSAELLPDGVQLGNEGGYVVYDSTNSRIIMFYCDATNSNRGMAIVGTVM